MDKLDTSAFGKNDIRGIYKQNVTPEIFEYTGKAFVSYICQELDKEAKDVWVSITQDARLHSPELTKAVIKGVTSMGANVIDLGLAPTPIGYYSEVIDFNIDNNDIELDGALIVTASHNPPEYNGLKMTLNRRSLDADSIKEIKAIAQEEFETKRRSYVLKGEVIKYNIIPQYIEQQLRNFPEINVPIKIVVDSANATGGLVAPKLYSEMGVEVVELYSEPDGNFPNHHPNPADEKTLDDIKAKVKETKADFGIAFDGDSDRVGIVDDKGHYITGDILLLIFALDVIKDFKARGEKLKVISEVKCSQVLFDTINQNGGEAIMWKTGHGYIKSKMKEEKALLAGEMSGHIFFKDRYYGFDDAIYAGCRFIEFVAKSKLENPKFKVSKYLKSLPQTFTSKEYRYPCPNELKKQTLEEFEKTLNNNKDLFGTKIRDIITIDGMRIIFDDGFAMIRQSNTEPVFTLRFESSDKTTTKHYETVMLNELDKILDNNKVLK